MNKFNTAIKIRVGVVLLLFFAFLGYVVNKLYLYQITEFEKYQSSAIEQQTRDTPISPKRGTIYDRNMKPLAVSSSVERVFISPFDIQTDDEARLISQKLSEILDVEYQFVYDKTQKKNRKDETIKKNVDVLKTQEIRDFIDEHKLKSIHFAQETKRTYPFSTLASHILGFTGAENNGLLGLELEYNDDLKGVPGRIITAKNAEGKAMPFDYESYIDAKNGNNLVLTIDWSLQSFLEKNLEAALAESQARERVTGIVIDVNTGEILAQATKPDFNLNSPYVLNDILQKQLDEMTFASEEEKKTKATEMLYASWKNKAITEPYEPGSTFKVITASVGLEEKAVSLSEHFACPGHSIVGGIRINCHLTSGHGNVTFAEGLQQSCNPFAMKVAEKMGGTTFLKYLEAFGYNEKTGVDLPGEAMSLMHNPKNFRTVELATSAFGQTFKVTPIQHITAISAIANGGNLVVPHLVKAITDESGNIIKSFDTQIKRKVLSEETCRTIATIMADGVESGGAAKNAFLKGYRIAAKTGTSQKRDDEEKLRIGSCVAFAPAENPQIAVLIIVDEPTVGSIYGGVNSAPYISKFLADALPYLGIEPKFSEQELKELEIIVQNYKGLSIEDAKKEIAAKGLSYTIEGEGTVVKEQIPKAGSILTKKGNVILYTDVNENQLTIKVPNVINLTPEKANKKIIDDGLNINIIGAENMNSSAIAITQSPAAGESVPLGTIITVEFRHFSGVH